MTKLKENPELLNELEVELREISGAVRRLLAGPVTTRAILLLIQDLIPAGKKIGTKDVAIVLEAAAALDSQYLRKKIKG